MATTADISSLVEELTCSVCLDLFQHPVTLECGHNFCRSCIDRNWKTNNIPSCPECRAEFQTRKYAVNKQLANVVVKTGKKSIQSSEAHVTQNVNQFCKEHEEKLKLFCMQEEIPICLICRDSVKHSGHNFLPLNDAVVPYKDRLKELLTPLESRLKELYKLHSQQKQMMFEISSFIQFPAWDIADCS
ncbi:zinc-binding protein A33-like isoform X1 [Protopterus annectens]|uniref:zinc-binding protein A33-like isoform X1 n=1 Tax=Protopterus annectens TaxID=7888 RepID=UPI001CF93C90|nr:zinc-binding protein A33-like isoform X1 [Protopterus annectens]